MPIRFLIQQHKYSPNDMVEVWQDGTLVGALYGEVVGGQVRLKLLSKYLGKCDKQDEMTVIAALNTYKSAIPS